MTQISCVAQFDQTHYTCSPIKRNLLSQLFPGACLGRAAAEVAVLKIALSRPLASSPLAAVLIMYAYHLGQKASRQTTSADVSVAEGVCKEARGAVLG